MAPKNATKPTARGPAVSLGSRIFLLSGALIAASVSTAVVFTALRARQVADEAVLSALDASQSAQESFEWQREKQLRLISRMVASDPSFVAYVAEADPASIRDLLEQRRQALGCDFAIVLDRAGRVLARTDRPGGVGRRRAAALGTAAGRGHPGGGFRARRPARGPAQARGGRRGGVPGVRPGRDAGLGQHSRGERRGSDRCARRSRRRARERARRGGSAALRPAARGTRLGGPRETVAGRERSAGRRGRDPGPTRPAPEPVRSIAWALVG